MIRLIAAIDEKRGLARNNQIPWKIPKDSTRFRTLTLTHGGNVLVGRTTYEQMGNYFDEHKAYVVSHQNLKLSKNQVLVKDLKKFLTDLKEDIWVIGGSGIYAASIEFASEIYITNVVGDFNCDQYFPDYTEFVVKEIEGPLSDNGFTFSYQLLTRL